MEKKATLKSNIEVSFVQWNDNCADVKRFCGDSCTITCETCAIDDYCLLKVFDYLRDKEIAVPIGHYVVKFDGTFIVLSPYMFHKLFNVD